MTHPLKFHWFLPTNGGDGRQVVGGGHGVDAIPVHVGGWTRWLAGPGIAVLPG